MRAGHFAVAVKGEKRRGDLVIPWVGIGKDGRRAGPDIGAFDFCHMPDANAGNVGNSVQRAGRIQPEVERQRGQYGQWENNRRYEKYTEHATSFRHAPSIQFDRDGACRLARRNAGTCPVTMSVTAQKPIKAAEMWENLSVPELIEHAVRRGEGVVGRDGQLIVDTRPHTGRSPKDKFFVREPSS